MKYLTLIFALVCISAQADVIKVVGKNGKEKDYSTDDYVVVKRRKGPKPAPKPAPVCEATKVETKVVQAEQPELRRNEVKLFAGVGPAGYDTGVSTSKYHISQGYDAILGLGFERRLTDKWSVEAIGCTNLTGLLGLGYSF